MLITKRWYMAVMMIFLTSFSAVAKLSDDGIWTYLGSQEGGHIPAHVSSDELPNHYGVFSFDQAIFIQLMESFANAHDGLSDNRIFVPKPDGSFAEFIFSESEVLHPSLAAANPDIKTFQGVQVDDPSTILRYDITPAGFHAQVIAPEGLYYVSPITDTLYLSFYAENYSSSLEFDCETNRIAEESSHLLDAAPGLFVHYGTILRTYRIAVAATGEYTMAVGGSKALALASIATAFNFVNAIYQVEVGVRFQIVPTNSNIIYTNPSTDPYTPTSGNATLLAQNKATIDAVIGSANYDVGLLFHALAGAGNSGAGVATLRSACGPSKARGLSTASRIGLVPINPFFYRILSHELGHQVGANHSFNASCGGNRNDPTAYEPGSGSTIMSYAAGCSPYNVQNLADTYFHRISLEEISSFLVGSGSICGAVTNTNNAIPFAEAGPNYTIPSSTPFVLTGVGSDANANVLKYSWEQFNNEIAPVVPPVPTATIGPNFRSFPPTTSPSRIFPRLPDILSNAIPVWEVLPRVARTMNFSLVVRDNVGGVSSDNMLVSVSGTSGPFVVTSPNGGETRRGSGVVTWNRSNTHLAPISVALVDILLSLDNGLTFPIVLANNTPNDGSQTVLMPALISNTARIQVRAEGNIFFDISNGPFLIRP